MKFSVSEIFTFCCQSCKKLYVCWRSLIRLLAFDVCWRSIIRLRATDFEEFYVCWRSIIRLLAFYVCWRSIIRLLAFYVCWRFTYAGATGRLFQSWVISGKNEWGVDEQWVRLNCLLMVNSFTPLWFDGARQNNKNKRTNKQQQQKTPSSAPKILVAM